MKIKYLELEKIAKQIRVDILTMSYRANSAHVGGALSCVEILVSLYFKILKIYPKNALSPRRDRLFFSKAHDAKALYSVLARKGFFKTKVLETYELDNGKLPGHSTRHCVPGVEISAGSLGHGLSMAVGSAYIGKINAKNYKVFCILSDGECDEGSIWEAILFASHHKLENLIAIVDYNKLQAYGFTKDVLDLEPFVDKWKSFGWSVKEIKNGHNFQEILNVLSTLPFEKNKPSVIIAHTVKGYGGVEQHVNQISSQYKSPSKGELELMLKNIK